MDLFLDPLDVNLLTPYVYPESWPEESPLRQYITLFFMILFGAWLLYISCATISYFFIFDHRLMKHPQFLPNQIRREIICASKSAPLMAFPTAGIFLLEVRGYGKLYEGVSSVSDWLFCALSVPLYLMFTDGLVYWIHRLLHHRLLYKRIHKDHHTWKVPSPFASHAVHPIDGFVQSIPYHLYLFLFPLHKVLYLVMFAVVNLWAISIHDGDFRVPGFLESIVNGAAHHTDHHFLYSCNYGQYFTLWDRIGGTFRTPRAYEGKLLLDDVNKEE